MSVAQTAYERINDYGSVKIGLASPHDIRSWSFGEVKKPETINYRTYRPERDGLFCERIFGPEKDWECACGKYRGMKYKGMICDRCGVKVTHSRVRRKRMGHIELAAPIVHIWFFKSMPSRLGALLNMKTTALEKVIYFQDYVVTDPGDTPLEMCQTMTEEEARQNQAKYGPGSFEIEMGAEAIKKLLMSLNLVELSEQLRKDLFETNSQQKRKDYIKRLKIVESLRDSDNRPEWMVLEVIPVIPPDLRPLVLLDSGNFATSDLNDLYRRIINRNNRLKKLVDLNAPEVIVRNEKRMLQQSVDALFDNNRCKRPVLGSSNRPLKSLTDMIKGKQGRFRENLLGKRVDYSARSVIVVGPELKLHQCGLPKKIALELFQPFIIRRLKDSGHADTIKSAKRMLERKDEDVWDILDEVIQNHPVLLNRAPTLHRMGIQAFEPILVEGNAIRVHPLVCGGFNADFDGDQMAVHLPLSIEAQVEATTLMLSTNNIFSPSDGAPIIRPSQDIVMGCYYLTLKKTERVGEGMVFSNVGEVHAAFQQKKLDRHAIIKVRMPSYKRIKGEGADDFKMGGLIETTTGRVIFNDILPKKMAYYNLTMKGRDLSNVISDCYLELGRRETINLLDKMKETGFRESTLSGLSFATSDLKTAPNKAKVIGDSEKTVLQKNKLYDRGLITAEERYNQVLDTWTHAREQITESMMHELENDYRENGKYVNPIYLMSNSGARGGIEQMRQLGGMRGLMAKPSGEIIETPIKANFREGLTVLEYFSSTHGARKGLADTALKTADSGYLTRKLADICQNVVVTEHDCGTTQGMTRGVVYRGEKVEMSLTDAIRGRVSRTNIVDPITDEVIVRENEMITVDIARRIENMGLEKIQVRSPMTCESSLGICRLCYGMDLSTGSLVEEGLAVGIIAAQSVGEPGTQLTMRTFHIGGTASREVEESEIRTRRAGKVTFARIRTVVNNEGMSVVLTRNGEVVVNDVKGRELERYTIPNGATLRVAEGDEVAEGQVICQWDPHSISILAEVGGRVRFEECVEGKTIRTDKDPSGHIRRSIIEHKGELHPQIIIEDGTGKILDFYYLPEKASIEVEEGQQITAGTVVAKNPRESSGTQDITGGLPRVTELFEARRPKDPSVLAEIDGEVEFVPEKKRGKRIVIVRGEDGTEVEHVIPHGKHLLVHAGDLVKAGDALVRGPLVPHDILRVSGTEAVQQYLLHEIQNVYRAQRVTIDDKHLEIIISRMLSKVLVEDVGDTNLLPGIVLDKLAFQKINEETSACVKVVDSGDTDFQPGDLVPLATIEEVNAQVELAGQGPASFSKPRPASASSQLLGITKASVQSESFISAASFQETTKVLTEAALAGRVDYLVGLKENVILGHLVPAGTGFYQHQTAEVRIRPEALEELKAEKERILAARMSLLNEVQPDKPVPLGGGQDSEEYGQGGSDSSLDSTPPSPSPNPFDE
ncbi:DNA-directed RNA polymerase subunit beta' [Gimesia chilikensis]|uniref:DNA-directed RNA polymerase subunit beta' n=1 Tax=Gimesia chilikensis TaxID=2605989 RepID=A0A517PXJ4_9PLAN|nr:DNA-directed RNA polymerase subunit beta' [Gimesia chilikensis]QDT24105.1 DNA-directed RNA polymerase subunit beta' [Gimesia chilikensis]